MQEMPIFKNSKQLLNPEQNNAKKISVLFPFSKLKKKKKRVNEEVWCVVYEFILCRVLSKAGFCLVRPGVFIH